MNAPFDARPEKYRKLKLSVDDLFAMHDAGVFSFRHGIELIEGELYQMASKNIRHERWRMRLLQILFAQLPDDLSALPEFGFRMSDEDYVEPDYVIAAKSIDLADLRGSNVALVIEVSDTTLESDLNLKARTYARNGVAEYWVLDVAREMITIMTGPSGDAYGSSDTLPLTAPVVARTRPDIPLDLLA